MYHRLNKEDQKFMNKVEKMMQKYKDFVDGLNSSPNIDVPNYLKKFPTKIKICTRDCEEGANLCIEIFNLDE